MKRVLTDVLKRAGAKQYGRRKKIVSAFACGGTVTPGKKKHHIAIGLNGNRLVQVVEIAKRYIEEHYHDHLCRAEVAKLVKMNPAYFSTVFSEIVGMTFMGYVEQVRLGKAIMLLDDPEMRVNEVSSSVGYSRPGYFRDVFKAYAGVAPSVWRIRARESR